MQELLIGRQQECKKLEQCLVSKRSEFVIVCGRRRIGKTFLIDSFFKKCYDFSFVGNHNVKTQIQLRKFLKALKGFSKKDYTPFKDWYEAFDALEEYLGTLPSDRKKVVFIDEMPWIDTSRSTFVSALESFWNGWANRRNDILLIASGSATSWMADKLIANQGGLHNRITQRLYIKPFTLKETEDYIRSAANHWVRYDILQAYMLTGGVPFYLSNMNFNLSIAQNIDNLCFNASGALVNEFEELYNALFTQAQSYISVVELLYQNKQGLTRQEIAEHLQINGKYLNTILSNLEQCDFVIKREIYGRNTMLYRLVDFFTLFYLKFMSDKHKLDNNWWTHHMNEASINSWRGLTFELICLQHHEQIKRALGIWGMATEVSTWRCPPDPEKEIAGAQVDMIISRADRMIHLCEIKFSQKPYNITADYERRLRERMAIFDSKTKNRKPLVHTFITTFGLGEGKHHSIVHSEVTMDDLFNN